MPIIEMVSPRFLKSTSTQQKSDIKKFTSKMSNGSYGVNASIEHLLNKLNSLDSYEEIPETISFAYTHLIDRNIDLKNTINLIDLTAKLAATRFNKKPKEILFTGFLGYNALDEHCEKLVSAGFIGCSVSPLAHGIEASEEVEYCKHKDPSYWSPLAFSDKKIILKTPSIPVPVEINLTFRQEQILNMICLHGMTNYQIAKRLSLSESTVKMHIGIVFKKYGVRDRSQLIFSLKEKIG